MDKQSIISLLQQFAQGSISAEQQQQLLQWLAGADPVLRTELLAAYENIIMELPEAGLANEQLLLQIRHRMKLAEQAEQVVVIPVYRKTWFRWIAAAVLMAAVLSIWLLADKRGDVNDIVNKQLPVLHDVPAPATVRATITLADGTKLLLDSAGKGAIAVQGNTQVNKTADDQVVYNPLTTHNALLAYNTLTVPKGSRPMRLRLADGTDVWLNVESSVTYPIAFTGNHRKVTITGEAYFEVAHNATKPFIVQKGDAEIQVLGTHFNVNAYDDEEVMKVTLLEGSVRLKFNAESVMLKPGEQGQTTTNHNLSRPVGKLQTTSNIDPDEVMAWKNGQFIFNASDIKTIMRQVVRWYDVEVVYEGVIPERVFAASLSRNTNLSELLKVLELSNIHFRMEGNRLIVKP